MPAESVYPDLEPLLPRVRKPIQYVGGEVGSVVKDWDGADVRWALCYPDAYEVGLPNQGVQILYEVLNERDGVLAERTYTVWPDLEALMREHGVPQFTLEAHRPVAAFDVLGLSFATEMAYTNLLTVLDLAGIPLFSSERTGSHPLVIAGGHSAFNPEPAVEEPEAITQVMETQPLRINVLEEPLEQEEVPVASSDEGLGEPHELAEFVLEIPAFVGLAARKGIGVLLR